MGDRFRPEWVIALLRIRNVMLVGVRGKDSTEALDAITGKVRKLTTRVA